MTNISILVCTFLVAFVLGAAVMLWINKFSSLTDTQKKNLLYNWLQGAVLTVEKEFGAGTGELKFAKVFQMFTEKFPELSKNITEEQFNLFLQKALRQMRMTLQKNEAVNNYVIGLQLNGEDQDLR